MRSLRAIPNMAVASGYSVLSDYQGTLMWNKLTFQAPPIYSSLQPLVLQINHFFFEMPGTVREEIIRWKL